MSELFAAFGLDWRLLLIQAFNFAILLAVLWKFLYTPILKMLDERRDKVVKGVKDAEEAAQKLAASDEEGRAIVASAAKDAEGLVGDARKRADEKRADMIRAAEAHAEGILAEANARAAEAQRQALAATEREIARTAMLAAEKLLKQRAA